MNQAIRRAAYGGGNFVPPASDEPEPPVGVLGAGHGGTNPPVKPDMSALIRQAAGR